jgi:hypothetical protein
MPVKAWFALERFSATDVVPTNRLLLPSTPLGTVPLSWPAGSEVSDAPEPLTVVAVMVPAVKLPEASRATMALAVFALVAVVAELATLPAVLMVSSLVSAIAALALMSALTMAPDSTTVPLASGRVIVRSAVGSVTASVVSKVLAVPPSKVRLPVVPISRLPVTVPPALPSLSSSSSWIAV